MCIGLDNESRLNGYDYKLKFVGLGGRKRETIFFPFQMSCF